MKKFLLLAMALMVSIFALCACENKKQENNESGNTEVVDNNQTIDEDNPEVGSMERDPEKIGKFTAIYNDVDFGPGVYYEKIKDELGQEIKPSDTSKPCGPDVKGDVTHHYYDGITIDTNYVGMITYISIDSDKTSLSCGAKVGMSAEEVMTLIGNDATEDEYSITISPAQYYYVTFIKDDDGTISHISIEDMSIEV